MAQMPNISGVAWSADESSYHPILFVQGSPVQVSKTSHPLLFAGIDDHKEGVLRACCARIRRSGHRAAEQRSPKLP
jgi:hypothetical protein